MIVLDTSVISELFRSRPEPRVVRWLSSIGDDVAITTITLAELLAGVRRIPDGARRAGLEAAIENAVLPFRNTHALLPFDERAAVEYADVLLLREKAGQPISTADAQIAAICRATAARCATRNTKDFVGTGVDLIDPWTM